MPPSLGHQPPNFARHSNVSAEQVVNQRTLFKVEEDAFDKAYAESGSIEETDPWISLYMKVGLYCGWSWQEFKDTPYPVIKGINAQIDNKLDNIDNPQTFLNWHVLYTALAISKCFGK